MFESKGSLLALAINGVFHRHGLFSELMPDLLSDLLLADFTPMAIFECNEMNISTVLGKDSIHGSVENDPLVELGRGSDVLLEVRSDDMAEALIARLVIRRLASSTNDIVLVRLVVVWQHDRGKGGSLEQDT